MIFQDYDTSETYGHQWKEDELFRYFRCQIDNSINFGWKPEDICIVTNLDFEYRGVNIVRTKLLCTYNKYFNKVFGIYELLKDNLNTLCPTNSQMIINQAKIKLDEKYNFQRDIYGNDVSKKIIEVIKENHH